MPSPKVPGCVAKQIVFLEPKLTSSAKFPQLKEYPTHQAVGSLACTERVSRGAGTFLTSGWTTGI